MLPVIDRLVSHYYCLYSISFSDSFDHYDNGIRSVLGPAGTGGVFCSYPAPYLNYFTPHLDQIVGTGILTFFLCVVIDERNRIPKVWHPMIFGFLVIMIGTAFGMNMGYPINPARDFGPRLFSLFTHGKEVFTTPYPSYFLAPIIGPLIGGPLGGWLYQISLGMHLPEVAPAEREEPTQEQEEKLLEKA
ncbi:aquaglyceroporin 1 domain protein [Oesophagostomum dentatum]|uniref:Aquaglyceroporin 1 domain protein n=1 Tax=Oesophagostomum dentatum TaxID=61180 RepID=A0A0B1SLK8_OESDE|nr:aquaglyceroporin 1 domain protein [Oesophagostomum dentatum]